MKNSPGEMLLNKRNGITPSFPPNTLEFERINSPFELHNSYSYSVTIPPSGPLGLT
jgi:hypothetical protein